MRVTMLTTLCGPSGNAFGGNVVDVKDQDQAEYLVLHRYASAEVDKKKPLTMTLQAPQAAPKKRGRPPKAPESIT